MTLRGRLLVIHRVFLHHFDQIFDHILGTCLPRRGPISFDLDFTNGTRTSEEWITGEYCRCTVFSFRFDESAVGPLNFELWMFQSKKVAGCCSKK